jgi:hypothetical protein
MTVTWLQANPPVDVSLLRWVYRGCEWFARNDRTVRITLFLPPAPPRAPVHGHKPCFLGNENLQVVTEYTTNARPVPTEFGKADNFFRGPWEPRCVTRGPRRRIPRWRAPSRARYASRSGSSPARPAPLAARAGSGQAPPAPPDWLCLTGWPFAGIHPRTDWLCLTGWPFARIHSRTDWLCFSSPVWRRIAPNLFATMHLAAISSRPNWVCFARNASHANPGMIAWCAAGNTGGSRPSGFRSNGTSSAQVRYLFPSLFLFARRWSLGDGCPIPHRSLFNCVTII